MNSAIAQAAVTRGFVSAQGAGVAQTTTAEASVAALQGFTREGAAAHKGLQFFTSGEAAEGLFGLVAGQEYFLSGAWPVLYSAVSAGQWTRSVGLALSNTSLALSFGPVIQKAA